MAVVQPLVRKGGRNRRMDKADALPGTLAARQRQTLTGTAGQKQFTVQGGYSLLGGMALLDVYINGVYITEYTATDGSTFTLTDGLDSASDEVVAVPVGLNRLSTPPGFVASAESGYISASSVPVTIPSATVAGDLLILFVMHRGTLTTPSGWTLVASQVAGNSNGVTQYLSCVSKVATSSDANAVLNIVQSTNDRIAASVSVYRKSQGSAVVVTSAKTSTSGTQDQPGASVQSTSLDQLVLFAQTQILALTGVNTTYSVPSGVTQITVKTGQDIRLAVGYTTASNKLESGVFVSDGSQHNDTASITVVIG